MASARHREGLRGEEEEPVSIFDEAGVQVDWASPCPAAINEAPFPRELLRNLSSAGFQSASPIQRHAWPLALSGWDLIGLAETGSGKTLAFLLPAFAQLLDKGMRGAQGTAIKVLVLAPTRELASQVEESARRFSEGSGLRHTVIYGGVPRGKQLSDLRSVKPHLVVACPGRLIDFLSWNQINLSQASYLVVDEADRLLDMGFEPQVRQILEYLPSQRQSMLFSATWPEGVQKFTADIVRNKHLMICIGNSGNSNQLQANPDVAQSVLVLPDVSAKERALLDQLRMISRGFFGNSARGTSASEGADKVLVFCNSRSGCDQTYDRLQEAGVQCSVIHGTYEQMVRENVLQDYRDSLVRVLVATDIAARGLDIEGITVVINFDPPHSYKQEDYVHRIGRTGRAGRQGRAITLLLPEQANQAKAIAEVMQRAGQEVSSDLEALASQARGTAKQRKAQKRCADDCANGKAEVAGDAFPGPVLQLLAWLLRLLEMAWRRVRRAWSEMAAEKCT